MAKARNKQTRTKEPAAGRMKSGAYGAHIIRTVIRGGREWQLHATKGWRNYRLAGGIGKQKGGPK